MLNKKRTDLSLAEQKAVLDFIDCGVTYSRIVEEIGCSKGTITNIKKRRQALISRLESNWWVGGLHTSRLGANAAELDRRVLDWHCTARGRGVAVSGPALKEAAMRAATAIGITDFRSSNGWLQRFQKQHLIVFRSVCGESHDIDMTIVDQWKVGLAERLAGYETKDIFNCDETGLFFRGMPDRTLAEKGDLCAGVMCQRGLGFRCRGTVFYWSVCVDKNRW
jgi:hypothetical protein